MAASHRRTIQSGFLISSKSSVEVGERQRHQGSWTSPKGQVARQECRPCVPRSGSPAHLLACKNAGERDEAAHTRPTFRARCESKASRLRGPGACCEINLLRQAASATITGYRHVPDNPVARKAIWRGHSRSSHAETAVALAAKTRARARSYKSCVDLRQCVGARSRAMLLHAHRVLADSARPPTLTPSCDGRN